MKETTIFMNGNSQAMRIPKEMRFDTDTVLIEKVGSVTVIVDSKTPWAALHLAQNLFSTDFMSEGRSVNPAVERDGILESYKK